MQSTTSVLTLYSHLWLFALDFSAESLQAFIFPSTHATCPSNCMLIYLNFQIFRKEYKLWNSSLRTCLVTSSLLPRSRYFLRVGPDILSRTMFSESPPLGIIACYVSFSPQFWSFSKNRGGSRWLTFLVPVPMLSLCSRNARGQVLHPYKTTGIDLIILFSLLSLFWKNKSRLMLSPCLYCGM
jgi:hypothetical protein